MEKKKNNSFAMVMCMFANIIAPIIMVCFIEKTDLWGLMCMQTVVSLSLVTCILLAPTLKKVV